MLDNLIASAKAGNDVRKRRRYFAGSLAVMSSLFFSALVISLFAADLNSVKEVGSVALMELAVVEDPPKRERPTIEPAAKSLNGGTRQMPSRAVNMQSISENPIVPNGVSTAPNKYLSRPGGAFNVTGVDRGGTYDPNADGTSGSGGGKGVGTTDSGSRDSADDRAERTVPEPPKMRSTPKRTEPMSLGVVNSRALVLPKPPYPEMARRVNAGGDVRVQVMIDETGNVVSAKAFAGHPMLRSVAEQAALKAKFTPTELSKVAIRSTGVIVYRFQN